MIQSPSDIDVSKIEFTPVKILDNGGKSVNIRYEGRNLMIETPSLRVPYGVNVFDKTPGAPPKYSVDMSLGGAEDNEQIRSLQEVLEAFDERMINAGVENAGKWFKMTNPNREVIKAFYTPLVKISRDAQGNPKPYPPTFKLALRKKKDGTSFETDFYDGTAKPLAAFPRDTPLEEILVKRANATAIIQCTGVWFAGGKFGTTWKAVQMRIDSQPEQIRGPAFKSDAPDIRAFVAKGLAAAAAPEVEEDAEDAETAEAEAEAEAEVVAAVLPPKKVIAPAKVAPAPAFEEEQVAEPVPVPKKVVKKVVTKKA